MNIIDKTRMLYYLNKLWNLIEEGIKMKNWKTTLGGIIATIGAILKLINPGFEIPDEVSAALVTVGIFIIGLFSKDNNVTGGTVQQ